MKLGPHTYKAWWDLHAWAGVIISLIAYVMFFFGTVTFFYREIHQWEAPPGPPPTLGEVESIIHARIADRTISPSTMRLNFPRPDIPNFSLSYEAPDGTGHSVIVDRRGLTEPTSNVADFFYAMHYLQFPGAPAWLYTLAGLVSGALLLVIVTGVLIHARDLVRQFHQFRPKKRLQVIWSDAHKVLGTIGIPFALVYAFTGAWMGLDSALTPSLADLGFHGDDKRLALAAHGPEDPTVEVSEMPGTSRPLTELLALAEEQASIAGPERRPPCRSVFFNDVGKRDATVKFYCGDESIVLWQRDGVRVAPAEQAPPTLLHRLTEVPYAMHFIEFAQLPFRVLYALLGLAGCLAILSGNWLWAERRPPSIGRWLVERLTLATGAGSLLACVCMLIANRFAISPEFEREAFWWSWLAVTLLCGLGASSRAHWYVWVSLAGVGLLVVPLLGLFTRDPFYDQWRRANVERAVDLTIVALGLCLLSLAHGVRVSNARLRAASGAPKAEAHVA